MSVEIPRSAWDAFLVKWRRVILTDTVSGLDEDEIIGAIGEIVGNGGESYGTMAPGLASGAGPWASMLSGLPPGTDYGALAGSLGTAGGAALGSMLGPLGTTLGGALGSFLGPAIASLIPTTTRIGRATPEMEAASMRLAALAQSGTLTDEQLRSIGFSRAPTVQMGVPLSQQSPEVQALVARQTFVAPSAVATGVVPRVAGDLPDLPGLAHGLASTVAGLDDGTETLREVIGATLLEQATRSPMILEMDERIIPLLTKALRALDAKAGARSGSTEAVAALDRAYSHPDPSVRSALRMADSMLGG